MPDDPLEDLIAERDRLEALLANSADRPLIETWTCPMCGSGIYFSVHPDGDVAAFGCEGDRANDFCEFGWSFSLRTRHAWHQEFMEDSEWLD